MTDQTTTEAARIARGRFLIVAAISITLFVTIADIAIAIMAGSWKPEISAIRLVFVGLLLWGMYRGRMWARLLFLILVMVGMAFAGAVAIEPPKANADAAQIFSLVIIVCGAVLVWFLSFDKSVVQFEQAQRSRYPRLFGPAGGSAS